MARGFDSKFVEAQQEEATRPRAVGPELSENQRLSRERQRTLQLSRARATADLSHATVPAHKRMLEQAIAALDAELQALDTSGK